MISRIGGELEISLELISGPYVGEVPCLPQPYLQKLNTGRAALYSCLIEILRRGGNRKGWVPSYLCPSVIATFRALEFDLEFYGVGDTLTDQGYLDACIEAGDTFLYVHYFGKKNVATSGWIESLDRSKSIFVIEDCVQASLNSNVGDVGNFAITSYRKFLPQPDGAFLWSDSPMEINSSDPNETFVSGKFLGKILRKYSHQDTSYLYLFSESEQLLEQDLEPRRMSWISTFLMSHTNISEISMRRQKNWRFLFGLLKNSSSASLILSPLYQELNEGEIPLGFPVIVLGGKRDSLQRYLAEQKIYCPVHWDLQHLRGVSGWQSEKNLSQSILTFPIDQRLNEEDLHTIIQKIESFEEG